MSSAQALSDDQIRRYAPSVFADRPWQAMSDLYSFVPTSDVVSAMRQNGFVPVKAMQSRTRIEGKGDFTKHWPRNDRHQIHPFALGSVRCMVC
jgi:hypothetical protein